MMLSSDKEDEAAESWRCSRNVDLQGGLVHACLDDLVIALYVTVDELLEPRRGPGHPPKLADSELVCLAVAQVLLGYRSERRWLRAVGRRLGHLFPYVCGQAAYNRRLRRAAPLVGEILHALAVASPSWCDQWGRRVAPPVPVGAPAREVAASPPRCCRPGPPARVACAPAGSCWPTRAWPAARSRRPSSSLVRCSCGPTGPTSPPGSATWVGAARGGGRS